MVLRDARIQNLPVLGYGRVTKGRILRGLFGEHSIHIDGVLAYNVAGKATSLLPAFQLSLRYIADLCFAMDAAYVDEWGFVDYEGTILVR